MNNSYDRDSRNGASVNRNKPFRNKNRRGIDELMKTKLPSAEPKRISKAENLPTSKEGVYFLPLGGTGEFGLNMNLYHSNGKWIIVDMGVSFDGSSSINVFMPKIDFINSIPPEDILGIFITHGPEDHLGGVQYLWRYIKRPVFATISF